MMALHAIAHARACIHYLLIAAKVLQRDVDSFDEDKQQLTDYLREKFAGIYTGSIPDEMTAKIVEVMVSRGVGSLGDAFEVIGLGEDKEAEEIVTMSRLDLEPQLLKEFLNPSKQVQASLHRKQDA